MSLVSSGNHVYDLTNLVLTNSNSYQSENRLSKGQWYFEFEPISGSNKYVIGFGNPQCSISANQNGEIDSMYVYVTGNITFDNEEIIKYRKFKADINFKQYNRVGLAIDLDNQYFMILSNNKTHTFKFNLKQDQNWLLVVRETDIEDASDTVSIFLRDFQHEAPFGSMPWGIFYRITCKFLLSIHTSLFALINLFAL